MARYVSIRSRACVVMLLRLSLLALLPVSLLPVLAACAAAPVAPPAADTPVVAAVIVKPHGAAAADQVTQALQQQVGRDAGVRYGRAMAGDAHVLYLTAPATREQVPALIQRLRASGAFQYIELDSMMKIQ